MNKKYFIVGGFIVYCIIFLNLQDVFARGLSTDLGSTYLTSQTCEWVPVSNKVTCYDSDADPAHQIFSGTSCPSGWDYHGPVEQNSCSNEVLCDNQNRQDYTVYRCHYISSVLSWGTCSNGVQYATSVRWASKNGRSCSNVALRRPCGDCGSSDGKVFLVKPSTNLCNVGIASTVTGSGPWYWSCTRNGYSDRCSASKIVVPGIGDCGTRHNKTYSVNTTWYPTGLTWCGAGSTPSNWSGPPAFPAPGTTTTWKCTGANGGSTVSCSASREAVPVPGVGSCGTRNTTYLATTTSYPSGSTWCGPDNPASNFSGGPYFPVAGTTKTWECTGINNGSTVPCSASREVETVLQCSTEDYPPYGAEWCDNTIPMGPPPGGFPWQEVDDCTDVRCGYFFKCGDGNTDSDETCDDGNTDNNDGCSSACKIENTCGTADDTYSSSKDKWPDDISFCKNGATATPPNPVFPQKGGSEQWTCKWNEIEKECKAYRLMDNSNSVIVDDNDGTKGTIIETRP